MKKKMYLIDVINEKAEVVKTWGTLNDFYLLLNCDTIDIVTRKIGRHYYDIICDDNGLFADSPKISAIDDSGSIMFVGNILIAGMHDEEGELRDLTDDDIAYIAERIERMGTRMYPAGYMMLTQCSY